MVLEGARLSAATLGAWFHEEHEHPEAQVTIRLPANSDQTASVEPRIQIVPSNAPHKGGWPPGVTSVVFHLAPHMLASAADEIHGTANFALRGGEIHDPIMIQCAQAALAEMRCHGGTPLLLDYLTHLVAGRLVRTQAGRDADRRPRQTPLTLRQLGTLREFIESRLDTGTSVRQLAAVIGFGPQRLTALMKMSTGFTPHAYVNHLRILKASQLLKRTQLPLAEIALTLGFATQSHFGSVFRKYLGITPREYRNRASNVGQVSDLPSYSEKEHCPG